MNCLRLKVLSYWNDQQVAGCSAYPLAWSCVLLKPFKYELHKKSNQFIQIHAELPPPTIVSIQNLSACIMEITTFRRKVISRNTSILYLATRHLAHQMLRPPYQGQSYSIFLWSVSNIDILVPLCCLCFEQSNQNYFMHALDITGDFGLEYFSC